MCLCDDNIQNEIIIFKAILELLVERQIVNLSTYVWMYAYVNIHFGKWSKHECIDMYVNVYWFVPFFVFVFCHKLKHSYITSFWINLYLYSR